MTKHLKTLTIISSLVLSACISSAFADTSPNEPVLMSADWATQTCDAWNKNTTLVDGLGGKWIANNQGRGYKIIHLYRSDCEASPQVELRISDKDGKAVCTYGGKIEMTKLIPSSDYLMYATTEKWHDMGAGKYGPMSAMMFGRLKFKGPQMEAMSVMGPFSQFLLLVGKIQSNESVCPK